MRRKDRGTFVLPSIKKPLNGTWRKYSSRSTQKPKKSIQSIIQSIPYKVKRKKEPPEPNEALIREKSIQSIIQSIPYKVKRKKEPPEPSETLKSVVETLGLSKNQVFKFYRNFQRISADKPEITREDLLYALEEEETRISQALFKMTIKDEESIEFDGFVRICTSWCLYSREDILKFCFDCFDADASGFIDETDFKTLTFAVNNGSPVFPGNFDAALQMVDENGDGVIDFTEFKDLDKRFPLILFPIFRLQGKIQRITLGERNWVEINERVERGRQNRRNAAINVNNKAKSAKRTFPKMTRLPAICLDPERIDALKRGKMLDI
jgi:Ca2+-binding EF-hand superfamily protein